MPPAVYKPIAWLLIAGLAIVAAVGEGLHLIPGCGHGVEVGNGVLLLGISLPEDQQPSDGRPLVKRPDAQDIPIYDEDLCAICSVVGQSRTCGDCARIMLVIPLVHDLPRVVLGNAPTPTPRLFSIRAPPLV